jgi:predicted DNA-binding transcriptional regulator YafY
MRADRLLAILLRLHARGKVRACDLARELEVSRRTILRDIAALGMAGIPVYTEGGHGGGIHLDPAYRVNLTGLSEPEAAALMRAFKQLPLADHARQQAAELGLLKLLAALPAPQRHAVQRVQQRIHLDPTSWWQERVAPPVLETLEEAIFTERRLRILYEHHDGTLAENVIEPYGLVDKAGTWYLVAQRTGEWRTYRVDRLHAVTLLTEGFVRLAEFDLAAHWQAQRDRFEQSFPLFHCTLCVSRDRLSTLQQFAEGRMQIAEEQEDAEWMTIHLRLTSCDEACLMVWGLGAGVGIVAPEELRAAVIARAQAAIQTHTPAADDRGRW